MLLEYLNMIISPILFNRYFKASKSQIIAYNASSTNLLSFIGQSVEANFLHVFIVVFYVPFYHFI